LIYNQHIIIQYDEKQRYVDVVIWIKVIWIWICIAYNLLLTLQLSLNIFNAHMGFTCAHVAKLLIWIVYKWCTRLWDVRVMLSNQNFGNYIGITREGN
jgi:hypothetical protein